LTIIEEIKINLIEYHSLIKKTTSELSYAVRASIIPESDGVVKSPIYCVVAIFQPLKILHILGNSTKGSLTPEPELQLWLPPAEATVMTL
jgi:hypothetical protein